MMPKTVRNISTILSLYDMKLFYKKKTKDALEGILSKQQEWKNGHFLLFCDMAKTSIQSLN
jgi:hypothetical protein